MPHKGMPIEVEKTDRVIQLRLVSPAFPASQTQFSISSDLRSRLSCQGRNWFRAERRGFCPLRCEQCWRVITQWAVWATRLSYWRQQSSLSRTSA
jgi:hypothetical protein